MKIINMMCKTIVSVLLLLFVALVTAEAQVTAIRAGKVVDPETGTILTIRHFSRRARHQSYRRGRENSGGRDGD
jgi:hypothetical protein